MDINTKELCKQIKKYSKTSLIWTLEGGVHYITNRHWAVRYDKLPREVLISLFSAFASQPIAEGSLVATRFGNDEQKLVSMKKIFDESNENKEEGVVTNIILDYGDKAYRVVKTGDYIIRLNNAYVPLANDDLGKCAGKHKPLSFCNNQLILLPVRTENSKEEEMILELLDLAS